MYTHRSCNTMGFVPVSDSIISMDPNTTAHLLLLFVGNCKICHDQLLSCIFPLTLKVLVATIDALGHFETG